MRKIEKSSLKPTSLAALCFAAMASIFIGCASDNTGLVFVDKAKSLEAGLEVTSFKDTPFVAEIEYDYSRIDNFNVADLEVVLERTIFPREEWTLPEEKLLEKYTPEQVSIHYKLLDSVTWDGRPVVYLKPRKASIKESVPGKVSIYCIDDLGIYRLGYKSSK